MTLPLDVLYRFGIPRRSRIGVGAPSVCPSPATITVASGCQANLGVVNALPAPALPTADQMTWWQTNGTTQPPLPPPGTLPNGLTVLQWTQAIANAAASWWIVDHPEDANLTGASPFTSAPDPTARYAYLYPAQQWANLYAAPSNVGLGWNVVPFGLLSPSAWQWIRTVGLTFTPAQWQQFLTDTQGKGYSAVASGQSLIAWATQPFTDPQGILITMGDQMLVAEGGSATAATSIAQIPWTYALWSNVPWSHVPWTLPIDFSAVVDVPTLEAAIVAAVNATSGGSGMNSGTPQTNPFQTAFNNAPATPPAYASDLTNSSMNLVNPNAAHLNLTNSDNPLVTSCQAGGGTWSTTSGCIPPPSCAASGGTWNTTTYTCTPAPTTTTGGVTTTEGVLIGAGVLGVVGLIFWGTLHAQPQGRR